MAKPEESGPDLEKLRERMERWRQDGLVVARLEASLASGDPATAREQFEEFERDLFLLEGFREALADLDAAGAGPETEEVRRKFSDPGRLAEIDDDILRLQLRVERRRKAEARREEEEARERERLVTRVRAWTEEGVVTTSLQPMVDGPLELLVRAVAQFEERMTELKRLGGEIESLGATSEEVHRIRSLLRDPERLPIVEEELLKLRLRAELHRRRESQRESSEARSRERFRQVADEWKGQGFAVGSLEELLGRGARLEEVEAAIDRTRRTIARLQVVREDLRALEAEGLRTEVAALEPLLKDVDTVDRLDEEVLKLHLEAEKRRREAERRRAREERLRQDIRNRLSHIEAEGFRTDSAAGPLASGRPLEEVLAAVERLEEGARRMRPLREDLQLLAGDLATGGEEDSYADEISRLRALATEPSQLRSVEDGLLDLEVRRERGRRERARREEIRLALEGWGREGYRIDSLLQRRDSLDLRALEREFVTVKIAIHTLKDYERELLTLPANEFTEEWQAIKRLLNDPENIPEVERRIVDLQGRVEAQLDEARRRKSAEGKVKREMMEKLSRWAAEGFRGVIMDRVESLVLTLGRGALDQAQVEFRALENDFERMRELQAVLDAMDARGFEAEVTRIRARLVDLSDRKALDAVEAELLDLVRRMQSRTQQLERLQAEDAQHRTGFAEQVAGWAAEGFVVTELQALTASDPPADLQAITRGLVVNRIRIQRLRQLRREVQTLAKQAPSALTVRGAELIEQLRDPEKLTDSEARVAEFRGQIERAVEDARRRTDIRSWLEERKAAGFNMSRLEGAMEREIDLLGKEYLVMKIKIQKLADLREDWAVERARPDLPPERSAEVAAIEPLLRDPERITEIRERLSAVKAADQRSRLEAVRQRDEDRREREEIGRRVTQWVSEGWRVESLGQALDAPPEELRRRSREVELAIGLAAQIEERIARLDTRGFEGEVEVLRQRIRLLQGLEDVSREVDRLEERILRLAATPGTSTATPGLVRDVLAERIARWKSEGLVVGYLEELLHADVRQAEKAALEFVVQLEEMRVVESDLAMVDTQGLEEEAEQIREILRDVRRLGEARDRLRTVEQEASTRRREERRRRVEERELRQLYATKLIQFVSDGYDVSRLERFIGGPLDVVAREFKIFEEDVRRLQWVRGALELLQGRIPDRSYRELESLSAAVNGAAVAENKARELLSVAGIPSEQVRSVTTPLPQPDPGASQKARDVLGAQIALLEAFGGPDGLTSGAGARQPDVAPRPAAPVADGDRDRDSPAPIGPDGPAPIGLPPIAGADVALPAVPPPGAVEQSILPESETPRPSSGDAESPEGPAPGGEGTGDTAGQGLDQAPGGDSSGEAGEDVTGSGARTIRKRVVKKARKR